MTQVEFIEGVWMIPEGPEYLRLPTGAAVMAQLDPEAVSRAIQTLGIENRVRVYRMSRSSMIGSTQYVDGVWEIGVDAGLTDTDWIPQNRLSSVLWHELGHAQDFETQSRETGLPIRAVVDASIRVANDFLAKVGWMPRSLWMEDYRNLPAERAANAVSDAHAEDKLSL